VNSIWLEAKGNGVHAHQLASSWIYWFVNSNGKPGFPLLQYQVAFRVQGESE
jgi:hypothetical protein